MNPPFQAEEKRIDGGHATEKLEKDKSVSLSDRIQGDRDGDATLFGGVLTSHSKRLYQMTQSQDSTIRFASLDLVGQLLRQGLLNPNETVPFLLALQGDVENEAVRSLALKLLLKEGERRTDLLRQRICAGVKKAYEFQRSSYPDREHVSAIVNGDQSGDIECVFGMVFKQGVASNKKQRQGLFKNLLSFFEVASAEPELTSLRRTPQDQKEGVNLALLSFVAQILAHLPYAAATDPLYIIHHISSTVTLQGGDIVDKLASTLRPVGLSSDDELDEANAGEDALEKVAKAKYPSRTSEAAALTSNEFDLTSFVDSCRRGAAMTLLLRLKTHLRRLYNLSDARCLEYDPIAKERLHDKGISKNESTCSFNSHVSDVQDTDNLIVQYAEFRRLMREESSLDEVLDSEEKKESDDSLVEGTRSAGVVVETN